MEHMDSDDLWELQAGRWHSPVLPLLASHVLAKRAGLGRATCSVRQRTRWATLGLLWFAAAAKPSLFGEPKSAVRTIAQQCFDPRHAPLQILARLACCRGGFPVLAEQHIGSSKGANASRRFDCRSSRVLPGLLQAIGGEAPVDDRGLGGPQDAGRREGAPVVAQVRPGWRRRHLVRVPCMCVPEHACPNDQACCSCAYARRISAWNVGVTCLMQLPQAFGSPPCKHAVTSLLCWLYGEPC